MRKHYLDNIRWATVVLVLVYHVFFLFNGVGILGGVGGGKSLAFFDTVASVVYPWFMVLLFVVAGISARYALQKRTGRQFIGDRCTKLLVPSTLGLFVLHWMTGWLNISIGGGMDSIPAFLRWPIFAISGTGPLWFAQMLFLFSALLLLVRQMDRGDRLWTLCGKVGLPVVLLLALPLWGGSLVLNMPLLTFFRFGIYGVAFFSGYFIFSHDEVQALVEKIHLPMLALTVVLGALYTWQWYGADFTSANCLQAPLTNAYAWAAVLAILGCGKVWFDRTSRFASYMTEVSFGLYVLHYPVVLGVCYILYQFCSLPVILNYLLALVAVLVLTPLVYAVLRRIPVVRYLVLGIRRGDKRGTET